MLLVPLWICLDAVFWEKFKNPNVSWFFHTSHHNSGPPKISISVDQFFFLVSSNSCFRTSTKNKVWSSRMWCTHGRHAFSVRVGPGIVSFGSFRGDDFFECEDFTPKNQEPTHPRAKTNMVEDDPVSLNRHFVLWRMLFVLKDVVYFPTGWWARPTHVLSFSKVPTQ